MNLDFFPRGSASCSRPFLSRESIFGNIFYQIYYFFSQKVEGWGLAPPAPPPARC